jgi:hypothetical protein
MCVCACACVCSTEEALPMPYVPPPPGYSKPEDGCETVTLDSYASTVFGKAASAKLDAWVCAEEEEAAKAHEECNYVMYKGELIYACIN